MEAFSFIVLLLLSLAAYSGGAAGKAGKNINLKPQIFDLALVLLIWTGAIYSRTTLDLNKWLLIIIWVILSYLVGVSTFLLRKRSGDTSPHQPENEKLPEQAFKKLWAGWICFSKRMGSFQSRILLSLFYFFFVFPFGLGVRMFSDPLRIKPHGHKSHWIPKKYMEADLEQSRRQS